MLQAALGRTSWRQPWTTGPCKLCCTHLLPHPPPLNHGQFLRVSTQAAPPPKHTHMRMHLPQPTTNTPLSHTGQEPLCDHATIPALPARLTPEHHFSPAHSHIRSFSEVLQRGVVCADWPATTQQNSLCGSHAQIIAHPCVKVMSMMVQKL